MKKIKNRKILFGLTLIIILGIFLRSYNFSDWLHFEIDQVRDAKIAIKAVEDGIGNLPLQGPRAAGSFLRLGPFFYYLEYLSAKFFGATPPGVAVGVLIFSILTLPLFYVFVRRYFNVRISLGLLAIFSVSTFMVMYSRFAWNPNLIPFFMLASAYALLRIVDEDEKRKNVWLLIFAVALSIGTQLHFLVFMILPTISAIFILIKKPSLKIWAWLGAFLIVVFFYLPIIINDSKTGGENAKEFLAAITNKSEKNDHSLVEKLIRNYSEHSLGHFLIISGQEQAEFVKIETRVKLTAPLDIVCDYDCRKNLSLGILAVLFFSSGLFLLIYRLFTIKKSSQKDFLIISALWLLVSLGVMTPLSYDIAPRFFLTTAPLAFIFLGIILDFLDRFFKKKLISVAVVVFLVLANFIATQKRFVQLNSAISENIEIQKDKILKERTRVTLVQQEAIVDYMESFYNQNGYPLYFHSESYYRRSFVYLVSQRKINQEVFLKDQVYRNGNYFLIYRTSADVSDSIEKYTNNFEMAEKKQFGTLTVFRFIPRNEMIIAENQIFKKDKSNCDTSSNVQKRYTWNEIFQIGECFIEDDLEEGEGL